MSALRLTGSTSGYSEITPPAVAGDQTFTLPTTGGTLDRINRAGNILQVVNATYSTGVSSSSSTYADTGLTATITPTSASSKILIFVNQNGLQKFTSDTQIRLRLLRASTTLVTFELTAGYSAGGGYSSPASSSTTYLDSPATTSAVTYKTQYASGANTNGVTVQDSGSTSTITLIEVAA